MRNRSAREIDVSGAVPGYRATKSLGLLCEADWVGGALRLAAMYRTSNMGLPKANLQSTFGPTSFILLK
jgi:hypothetical protein